MMIIVPLLISRCIQTPVPTPRIEVEMSNVNTWLNSDQVFKFTTVCSEEAQSVCEKAR